MVVGYLDILQEHLIGLKQSLTDDTLRPEIRRRNKIMIKHILSELDERINK